MHAKGHVREAFEAYVDAGLPDDYVIPAKYFFDGQARSVQWLLGKLWHCSDIMPWHMCRDLRMPRGSTYAAAVHQLGAESALRA